MWEIIYLNLLIFGGILFQGILGSFLEDNLKNASNLHLRTKRMVPGHMVPGHMAPGDMVLGDSMVPGHTALGRGDWMFTRIVHIVKICLGNDHICTGVIVTPRHILVPMDCIDEEPTMYKVKSVKGVPDRGLMGTHRIRYIFEEMPPLYLLLIDPPIPALSRFSRPILPAAEALPGGMHPTIIAWDATGHVRPIIRVQILEISETHVYTVQPHEEHDRCFDRDRGAALVVGDRLFAVLVEAGDFTHGHADVFMLVNNNNEYYVFLMQHIQPYLHSHPHLYNPAR